MLQTVTQQTLTDLQNVLFQLHSREYSLPLTVLKNSSLGKHTRHILDFYHCLYHATHFCTICYDNRERNELLEQNPEAAIEQINVIVSNLSSLQLNEEITLHQHFLNETIELKTSIKRELLYNVEHTIHHCAIMRIGLEVAFPTVEIPNAFGMAYSTMAKEWS